MKERTAISVIIPVYKVEKYLNRCVDSVLAQTFTDYEVILVDDGSPDKSPEICDNYAKQDNRFLVIHKENGGLSSARNAGIKMATGKYIFFLDSDDWIDSNTFEEQYELAEREKVDFIRTRAKYANWPSHNDGEVCVFGNEQFISEGKYTRSRIETEVFPVLIATNKLTMGPIVSAGGGLYRTDFIKDNNLCFYENIKYSEDLIFNVHAVLCSNSFYYLDSKQYYNYFYNSNSITKAVHSDIWENDKGVIQRFDQDFKNCSIYDFSNQLRYNKLFYILDSFSEFKKETNRYKRISNYKTICNDSITVEAFQDLSGLDISWKLYIILLLIKYRQSWLLAMI